jgi:RNA polymerase sigma-70 factor (ECF subfamily)
LTESITLELILRAQRGSPDDAGELYARYYQRIYRYLYYRTGDLKVAEDLTADVFVKMVQSLASFQPDRTPFTAWLFQVARNQVIDHYRRSAAHPQVSLNEDLDSSEQDLDGMVDLHLSMTSLARAMAGIEETQRDVLLLRFIEELPISETADILHRSEDSVKALQYRGLIALRTILKAQEKDL